MFSDNKGFTILEILIALGIMVVGFLAMSQMQYLSLRQSSLAESGTLATNIIQFASDRDMEQAKRLHLLNSRVYADSRDGKIIDKQTKYCTDGVIDNCTSCPCDPFSVFLKNSSFTQLSTPETRCAPIELKKFDPKKIQYFDTVANCLNPPSPFDDIDPNFILLRKVDNVVDTTVIPTQIQLTVSYAIKNKKQINDTGLEDSDNEFSTRNSLAVQNYEVSAHVDTGWTSFISIPGSWNLIVVPHIP
ncbi:MAG: type IV pilus modification PilV family protein [Thermodesulfobacteriota bacterium]